MTDFADVGIVDPSDTSVGAQANDAPYQAPAISDYGKALVSGGQNLAATIHAGSAYLQSGAGGDPEEEAYFKGTAQQSRRNANDTVNSMTPSAKSALDASITSGQFWQHPLYSSLMQGADMAPGLVAAALPGALVAGPLGAGAGMMASVGTNAALSATQLIDAVDRGIDDASDEELKNQTPAYANMRTPVEDGGMGMSVADAKSALQDHVTKGNGRLALAALAGAVGGGVGLPGMLAGGARHGAASLLPRVGMGATEAGGAMGVSAGLVDAAQQSALQESGAQQGFNTQEWAQSVIGQLVGGAALGGLHGVMSGGEVTPKSKAAPGQATAIRSDRVYDKPDSPTPPAQTEVVQPAQPVDAAASAALNPNTPSVNIVAPGGDKPIPAAPAVSVTAPAVDKAVPESPDTLKAQQAELVAGQRPAMVFKGGDNLLPVPEGMKQTKFQGDIYQYDPNKVKYRELLAAVKNNTIGELLGLGPVTKDEAVAGVQAGATPVAVTERAPDGTELKAAAGTDQTAPTQIAALESGKAPGSNIQVERPEDVVAQRQAAQAPSLAPVAPPVAPVADTVNPATTQLFSPTQAAERRILPDITPEGKAAADANAKLTDNQIEANREVAPNEVVGKRRTKAEIAQRLGDNATADGIMHRFEPHPGEANAINPLAKGGVGARLITKNRALAMLDDAARLGLKIPESLKDNTNEEMNHGPGMALLVEAKALTAKKAPVSADYERFIKREYDIRSGSTADVLAERRAEGAKASQPDLAIEGAGDKTGVLGQTESHEDDVLDKIASEGRERPAPKIEGPAYTVAKAKTQPTVVVQKTRGALIRDRVATSKELAKSFAPEASRTDKMNQYRRVFREQTGRPPNTGEARDFERYLDIKEGTASETLESWGPEIKQDIQSQIARARAETNPQPSEAQKLAGNYDKGKITFEGNKISIENPKGSIRTGVAPPANAESLVAKHWKDLRDLRMSNEAVKVGRSPVKPEGDYIPLGETGSYVPYDKAYTIAKAAVEDGSVKPWPYQFAHNLGIRQIEAERMIADMKKEGVAAGGKAWAVKMPGDYGYIRGTEGADGDHVDVLLGGKGETGKAFIINQKDPKTGAFDEHKVIMGVNTEAEARAIYGKSFSDGSGPKRIGSVVEVASSHLHDLLNEHDTSLRQPVSPLPGTGEQTGPDGQKFTPIETTSVGKLMPSLNLESKGVAASKMQPFIARKLQQIVGDVPVHWVDESTMVDLFAREGKGVSGYYDPNQDHIVLNSNVRPEDMRHVVLHEAIHAATAKAIETVPGFREDVRAVMDVAREAGLGDKIYAMSNEHEFLAEAMSNRPMQEMLARTPLSPELAERLNLREFRTASLWSGIVNMVRRALGLPPGTYTALEAAMHLTEGASWVRRPADAMAFGSRLDAARARRVLPMGQDIDTRDQQNKLFEQMSIPEFRAYVQDLRDKLPQGSLARQSAGDELGNIDRSATDKLGLQRGGPWYPPTNKAKVSIANGLHEMLRAEYRRLVAENDYGARNNLAAHEAALGITDKVAASPRKALPLPMQEVNREIHQPREEASQRVHAITLGSNLVRGLIDRSPSSEGLIEKGVKLLSNDQMRQAMEKHFGALTEANPLRRLTDTVEKMGVRMQGYLKKPDALSKDLYIARRQFEGDKGWDTFAKLTSDATTHNLHPDAPLDSQQNAHLRLPKGAKSDDQAAMKVWQSRAKYPELSAAFNSLPAPLKELWARQRDYYANEHAERSKAVLTALLKGHDPTPGSTIGDVVSRALSGSMSEADTEHYEKLGIGKALKGASEFQTQQGFYAPKKRFGDYVVTGEHEVATPDNAKRIDKNTLEFNTRQEAHDFVSKSDLPAKADTVYYDPATGKQTTKEGGLSTAGNSVQKYQVSLERQHVDFADTIREAKAVRQAMQDAGIANIKDLDRREKNPEVDYSLSSPQVQSLMKGVDRRQDLSDGQKAVLKKALAESSIAMKSGNRLEPHYLKRRNVAGASDDVVRTLNSYARASAAFKARSDFSDQTEGALKDMRDKLEANRSDGATFSRRIALQEMESRLFGFGSPEYSGRMAPFWQKVMAMSFWKRMMSPAHLLLHMTHPGMISGPVLGARHGFGQAYRELYRSYRDMGGVGAPLIKGIMGAKDVFTKDSDATNFLDYFRSKLSRVKDSAGVLSMLKELEDTGHIHANSGMEVQHYGENATRVQAGMERVDRAFREITSSTESINRVAEALAAYRLELRRNGADHDAAVRYTKDTLANTQGLYSATNAAPIFRNKALRPFLQFKQFPQMIYHLLGKNLYNTFKGDTPEVRREAVRAFSGVVATHAAMAGLLGLPMELIKAPVMLANALTGGATPNWDSLENKAQEGAATLLGPQLGEIAMHGLSRALGPFSVDVHHRLGLDSLFTFGEPKSGKTDDVMHWLEDTVLGAPGSMLSDTLDATHAAANGDWEGAFEKATPVKALDDLLKAGRLGIYGKPSPAGHPGMAPMGVPETIMQGLGFKPAAAAQYDAARWASEQAISSLSSQKSALVKNWVGATGAQKARAMQAISSFNASQPVDQRITTSQLQGATKRETGAFTLGQKVTNKNKTTLDSYKQLYNVQ